MIAFAHLLALTFGIYFLGTVAVLLLPRKAARPALVFFGGVGSLALLVSGIYALFSGHSYSASLWTIPYIGNLTIAVDRLSAFFLVVTSIVAMPASLFAAVRNDGQYSRSLAVLFLALLLSLFLVLIAANVFLFFVTWEIMSILIYLMINQGKQERPGYLMLATSETGTLAVLVALLLLSRTTGTLYFEGMKAGNFSMTPALYWVIFILSFAGFGVKAGLIPLNFWLPRAYTATPPSYIPLMAGATLNLGLYGIIRVNMTFLPMTQAGPGVIMLVIGSITAFIGVLYATIEDDLKTLLAHSSIENAGIITASLGAGAVFLASGHRVAAAMALVAAFYHLSNHSVFKTLLFMGAGELEGATGIRSLDRLGGLLKRMPWTGFFVLVGALSISAMPPFNGFVSEWLTFESLLRSVELSSLGIKIAFVAAGVVLALTAGLAVTCFVRAFAMGFLGMPRSEAVHKARETRISALVPMAFLALLCLVLGVLPTYVIPTLDKVIAPIAGASGTKALVPPFFKNALAARELPPKFVAEFHDLGAQVGKNLLPGRGLAVIHRGGQENPVVFAMSTSYMFVTLVIFLVFCAGAVWLLVARHRKVERRPRWDGGVRRFLPEMTYTATGFAQPVRVIFEAILRPKMVSRREVIASHFRVSIEQKREEVHLVDRFVLYPMTRAAQRTSSFLARMHNGQINAYAAYALLALVVFLILALAV